MVYIKIWIVKNKINLMFKKYFDYLIFCVLLFLGIYFHMIPNIGIDFSFIPGDLGDSRFNNYILEHGYLYVTGRVDSFWSAPFMYPVENVIALSDNLLGTMPIYAMFRIFGADAETSYQIWFVILSFLNFFCSFFVINKLTKNISISAISAYIFTFDIIMFGQYGHLQVLPKFIIPFTFYYFIIFFKSYNIKFLIIASLTIVYQFYCGIYLGFLLFFSILIVNLVFVIFNFTEVFAFIKKPKNLLLVFLTGIASILLLLPLVIPYFHMSKEIGLRDFSLISLPTVSSYFFVREGTLLWKFLENTGKHIPNYWEHFLFVGGLPILCLLLSFIYFKKLSKEIKVIIISLFFLILFTIKIGNFTLYKYVYLLPGFGSMAAIGRIIHIELFFYAIIVSGILIYFYNKVNHKIILLSIIVIILFIDQYKISEKNFAYPKNLAQKRIENILKHFNRNNNNFDAFAVFTNSENQIDANIDAMRASQKVLLPTLNSYSSTCIGINCDFNGQRNFEAFNKWAEFYNIEKKRIFIINLD